MSQNSHGFDIICGIILQKLIAVQYDRDILQGGDIWCLFYSESLKKPYTEIALGSLYQLRVCDNPLVLKITCLYKQPF